MKHISFGKISDYFAMIKNIAHTTRFEGIVDGESTYNNDPLPKLFVSATTKMHGSNASVTLQDGEIACQSKNQIIQSGHFSFPEIVAQEKGAVLDILEQVKVISDYKEGEILTVFGEIIGPGVQQAVAINQLSRKYWVIFAAKITKTVDGVDEGRWVKNFRTIKSKSERIANVYSFGYDEFLIDFGQPKLSQNLLVDVALMVEAECPVAKGLENISGVGEGIVMEVFYKGQRFTAKVKGDKHSAGSKVKKMAQVDPVKVASVARFVEHAATESRVRQAMSEITQIKGELSKANTGDIIKWIANDILAEEMDVLKDNDLEYSSVAGSVANAVRMMYSDYLNESVA